MSDLEVTTAYALAGIGAVALWEGFRFLLRPPKAAMARDDRRQKAEYVALKKTVGCIALILHARERNRAAALKREAERFTVDADFTVLGIEPDPVRGVAKDQQFRNTGAF